MNFKNNRSHLKLVPNNPDYDIDDDKDIGFLKDSEERPARIAKKILHGKEVYETYGFADIHTHVLGDKSSKGIQSLNPEIVGVKQGVTVVVDAGSCGINNFEKFKHILYNKHTSVKFFINISRYGLQEGLSELADMNNLMTLDELIKFKSLHGEHLVGIKVRMSYSVVKQNGLLPLIHAKKLSKATNLPLMVHIGNAPPALGDILNLLEKRDIVTHFLHGKPGGILDFKKEYISAANRGVTFDVGHGTSSFCFRTAEKVLSLGKVNFTISTDVYEKNLSTPVGSLMETMSKFFALGYSLEDIVSKVTFFPMYNLKLHDVEYTNTLFTLEKPDRDLVDSEGYKIKVDKVFKPFGVVIGDFAIDNVSKPHED